MHMPGFDRWLVHVCHVVGQLALGKLLLRIFRSLPVGISRPAPHIHAFIHLFITDVA